MSDSVSSFSSFQFFPPKGCDFLGRDYALLSEFPFWRLFSFLVFMSSAVMQNSYYFKVFRSYSGRWGGENHLRNSKRTGALTSGPVPLPKIRKFYGKSRSTFVNKTAKRSVWIRVHKNGSSILLRQTVNGWSASKSSLPAGVWGID